MKKFLSLLLAMTMILSLVIVPAQAASPTEPTGSATLTINGAKGADGKAKVGDSLTFSLTAPEVTDDSGTVEATSNQISNIVWKVNNAVLTGNSYTVTDSAAGTELSISYTATINYKIKYTTGTGSEADKSVNISGEDSIAVEEVQQLIYVEGLALTAKIGSTPVDSRVNKGDVVAFEVTGTPKVKLGQSGTPVDARISSYSWTNVSSSTKTASWTADETKSISCDVTITYDGKPVKESLSKRITVIEPDLRIAANVDKIGDNYEVLKNGTLTLSASSTGVSDPHYIWLEGETQKSTTASYSPSTSSATNNAVRVTCRVYEGEPAADGSNLVAATTCTYQVVEEDLTFTLNDGKNVVLTEKGKTQEVQATLSKKSGGTFSPVSGLEYNFTLSKNGVATISPSKSSSGKTTITLSNSGTVKLTASVTYKGYSFTDEIEITGRLLTAKLDEIENGKKVSIDYSDLKNLADDLLPSGVSVKRGSNITISDFPKSAGAGGEFRDGSSKLTGSSYPIGSNDELTFFAAPGYIGDTTMNVSVVGDDNNTYKILVTIPIISAGDIKETVTGSSASSSVSFDVDDVVDYNYLYIYGSKSSSSLTPSNSTSDYDAYWSGANAKSGWVRFDDTDTVTIPASAFSKSTGKVTLYVVGIDKDGVAYTGTIEVSQKSYAITYNVVAGSSVAFEQKDFEDFFADIADDNGDYNSRRDTLSLDYVTFSLPTASNGVLYEGSSKIARNEKIYDLDKVTFDAAAKAKDTITISFTAYGKVYKSNSSRGSDVSYNGTVEISVIKEDIVYEVGVNSSIKFNDSDFVSYLQGYSNSYKKATLSYVTFNVGRNSAITSYFNGTGALYRYYSAYGVSSTVSSSDEFYYNPKSSSKNYDLADVTYVTSKFAKAGDVVYIPFTAYGTGSQKAEGTVAIKVKQTMNFTDVHTYDYFYDAVQWAVNNDITKGTSATTFSPKMGCTRAQIVTFLWRAAGSPAPRSSVNKFTDVSPTAHADYMKAIIWATEQGITTGTDTNKFSPDATCTRAQIVTFLYRYKSNPAVYGSLNFTDVNKTEHSAYYNAILWAVNNKIATGYGNSTFDPNGTCNRGDAVTFLYRALA